MRTTILNDKRGQYQGDALDFLQESSALDTLFYALPHLNDAEIEAIFNRSKSKARQTQNQVFIYMNIVHVHELWYVCDLFRELGVRVMGLGIGMGVRVKGMLIYANYCALICISFHSWSCPSSIQKSATSSEVSIVRRTTLVKDRLLYHCLLVKWWKRQSTTLSTVIRFGQVIRISPFQQHQSPVKELFPTARDAVNAKRSQLLTENIDLLVLFKKIIWVNGEASDGKEEGRWGTGKQGVNGRKGRREAGGWMS